jgi:hypothetical protein
MSTATSGPTSVSARSPARPTGLQGHPAAVGLTRRRVPGGTDICSLFAGCNRALPVYRGEIQCACLGMAIQAWAGQGRAGPGTAAHSAAMCSRSPGGRQAGAGRERRSGVHQAVPVHACVLLGRRGWGQVPEGVLQQLHRHVACSACAMGGRVTGGLACGRGLGPRRLSVDQPKDGRRRHAGEEVLCPGPVRLGAMR